MQDKLKSVAESMRQTETELRGVALDCRNANSRLSESSESVLIHPVSSKPFSISVAAVDGGIIADRVHGSDIIIGKSVSVNFVYCDSQFVSCHHLPDRFPETKIEIKLGLDEHEALVFRQLFRLQLEISAAINAVEKFKPDLLLLDGSILPLGSDRPSKESSLFAEYSKLMESYKQLFALCRQHGCQLAGIIKDSRGKRLMDLLGKDRLNISDTFFTNFLLKEKERTAIFPYASENKKTPVMKDLGDFSDSVFLFYLKPSDHDLPLRIEFFDCGKSIGEIASILLSLCSLSSNFAYPAILIEADLCAAMDPLEMERVKKELFMLSKGAMQELRRNSRPFR